MRRRHYERLERGLFDVLAALQGTLTESEVGEVRHFIDHDEYGIALETLCDVVGEKNERVPREVYDRVCELGATMGMERGVERRLGGSVFGQRKPPE